MFDQSAYTVEEGETVNVTIQLCGNITGDVMVSVTTEDGTASIAHAASQCTFRMVLGYDMH